MPTPTERDSGITQGFVDRRALVTGHTGFKGSWLAIWLRQLGAVVTGLALSPVTRPNNFEASGVARLLDGDVRADIRDRAALRAVMDRVRPEVIFHLAAQPIVRRGLAEPFETFDVNVMGTAAVLEAVRLAGRPCVVIVVTSDKCYRPAPTPHTENDPLGGNEPYGTSKAAAELVTEAYRSSYFSPELMGAHGVKVATVRAGNVIGGGDWSPDRALPDLVRALASGQPVPVRAPAAVRPWQHVLVPLSGYLTLAARLLSGPQPQELCTGWNFGPLGTPDITVGQLVEAATALWGSGSWQHVEDATGAHEATYLGLDSTRASSRLGWVPAWSFEESLEATVRWYRDYYRDPRDMLPFCIADIDNYMARSSAVSERVSG